MASRSNKTERSAYIGREIFQAIWRGFLHCAGTGVNLDQWLQIEWALIEQIGADKIGGDHLWKFGDNF